MNKIRQFRVNIIKTYIVIPFTPVRAFQQNGSAKLLQRKKSSSVPPPAINKERSLAPSLFILALVYLKFPCGKPQCPKKNTIFGRALTDCAS
jgi:hypothetical protein